MKPLVLLATLLVTVGFVSGQQQKPAQAVRVAAINAYPAIFEDSGGKAKGIMVDALESIAKKENWSVSYVFGSWKDSVQQVKNGKADIVALLPKTPDRMKEFDFGNQSLSSVWYSVFIPVGSDIKSLNDLDGLAIAVVKEDLAGKWLHEQIEQIGIKCQFVEKKDDNAVLASVVDGESDAGILLNLVSASKQVPNQLKTTGDVLFPQELFLAVPKGAQSSVIAKIDSHLAVWRSENNAPVKQTDVQRLTQDTQNRVVFPAWVQTALIGLLALVLVTTVAVFVLRYQVARAVSAIKDSENRLKFVTDSSNIVVWHSKTDLKTILYLSESFELVWGRPATDTVRSLIDWIGVVHEDDRHILHRAKAELARCKSPTQIPNHRIVRPDGSVRWISTRVYPVADDTGEIASFVGIAEDVTQQIAAEEELKRSEELWSQAIEGVGDGVWAIDMTRNKVFFSANWKHMLGYADAEIANSWDEWFNRLHDDDRDRAVRAFEEYVEGKADQYSVEFRMKCKDETYKWILARGNAIWRDEAGKAIRIVGIHTDVNVQKNAVEAMRRSENRLNEIIENMPNVAIQIYDDDAVIRTWNPASTRFYGISESEAVGKHFNDIFTDKIAQSKFKEAIEEVKSSGKPVGPEEWDLVLQSGIRKVIKTTIFALPIEPSLPRIVSVDVDITEQKLIKEALEKRVLALTQPLDEAEEIAFETLFNIDDIQKLQDIFAEATGVASIITHPDGTPITKPSRFCRFCNDIVRKTEKGLANCYKSDASLGRLCLTGPTVKPCLSGGLWDAGASISVGGRHIANWLIGQVRDATQTEDKIRKYAREIETDEEELVKAFREVPHMERSQFEAVSQALFSLASQLSSQAYQNVQQARFIAERKKVEDVLRDSEERYRNLIEGIPDMVIVLSLDRKVLYANRVTYETTGLHLDESTDTGKLSAVYHDEDRLKVYDAFRSFFESGRQNSSPVTFRLTDATNTIRWFSAIFSHVTYEEQPAIQMICRDTTEQTIAEQALKSKTEELNQYFESALDLLCILDSEGHYYRLNPEWEAAFGYRVADMTGKNILEFVHPDDIEDTKQIMAVLSEQKSVRNFINRHRHIDGSYRWLEWRSFPHTEMIYAVVRDITERVHAEEKIKNLNTELELRVAERTSQYQTAIHELESFAYSISHDLRAPLRALDGYSKILIEDYAPKLDNEAKATCERISSNARRMGSLIEDLLEFSRVGRSEIKKQRIDMKQIVKEVFDELVLDLDQNRIEFILGELPDAYADPTCIRQVAQNLIANAVKFTRKRDKAVIEVGFSSSGESNAYYVRDNGAGFDMAYADKLFGVFQRLHRPTEFEGTGVGLAIVQRLITRNGGRVWAYGEVDKGATISFTLPLAAEAVVD